MYRPLRRRSRWGAPLNQALMGELAKANRLALNLFIQYQVVERTPRFFANITRKMRNRGMAPAAEALQKEFGDRVGPLPAGGPPARQPQRGHLPPACPQCGAPLRSDEVEWIDARSVECVYCGSVVRTEA